MRFRKIILVFCAISSLFLFICGLITLGGFTDHHNPAPLAEVKKPETNYFLNLEMLETRPYLPPVNLLLFGLDKDGLRSDVMILVNYNPGSNKINMLSIARDTRIYVNGKTQKLNALIGIGGEKLAMAAIEKLTGIKPDYYLTINFKGFRKIIDVLGGVEVNVPQKMNYDDSSQDLHIHLNKGLQVLDGNRAEQYIRYRKGNLANQGYLNGDLDRIKVQQSFIKEFIRQKFKLRYITKADDIFMLMGKYVRTNITLTDINKYVFRLKDISGNDIKTFTNSGEAKYIGRISYFICNVQATRDLIQKNFSK